MHIVLVIHACTWKHPSVAFQYNGGKWNRVCAAHSTEKWHLKNSAATFLTCNSVPTALGNPQTLLWMSLTGLLSIQSKKKKCIFKNTNAATAINKPKNNLVKVPLKETTLDWLDDTPVKRDCFDTSSINITELAARVKFYSAGFFFFFFRNVCPVHCHFCLSVTLLPTGANMWNGHLPPHAFVPE